MPALAVPLVRRKVVNVVLRRPPLTQQLQLLRHNPSFLVESLITPAVTWPTKQWLRDMKSRALLQLTKVPLSILPSLTLKRPAGLLRIRKPPRLSVSP